ncbi:MAG: rod shape-determining protein RodA [Ignavibacteriaceae bacterium]|nr:rod shape-determining protein RodA [Ignavibacteriaceae bacterium]
MRIDYKLKDKFDLGLAIPALILFCIGLAAIYSSTLHNPHAVGNFNKQLFFGVASIILFFVIYSVPTNVFRSVAVPTYIVSLLLLVVVLVIGKRVSGAKAWLGLAGLGFQPSELAKLGTAMVLAAFLSRKNTAIDSFKDIFLALLLGLVPIALVLAEPDVGTTFVFTGLIIVMLFWKGISLFGLFVVLSPAILAISSLLGVYYFVAGLVLVVISLFMFRKDIFFSASIFTINLAVGFFTSYVLKALKEHQQARIRSFINPAADPLGAGYNAIQAKVAIGSGGLWGKGFLAGSQTQLQFIPEQWTDFIYCVIGEEFGFIGTITVLGLFLFLFIRILKLASTAKDEFLSLVLIGILSIYFIHFLVNVGMVVGIVPVVGIPLPFVSYGGSSLLASSMMLGIAANVYRTKKNYT